MATPAQWLAGARPRTLPAALAPVLVGTGAAAALDGFRPGARRCSRWWSRSRCRSRSTTPTTTPTAAAAPTPTGSGPMRLVGSGRRHPARRCWSPRCLSFAVAARRRARPGRAVELVAGRRRRRLHRRGLDLHRRSAPLRLPGARRGVRLRLLRPGRRRRDDVRADPARCPGLAFAVAVPVGLLIVAILVVNNLRDIEGDAAGRQAHPGGPARRPAAPGSPSPACSSSAFAVIVARRRRPALGAARRCSRRRSRSRRRARCCPAAADRR